MVSSEAVSLRDDRQTTQISRAFDSLADLSDQTVPDAILTTSPKNP